jgi:hypothetical protein
MKGLPDMSNFLEVERLVLPGPPSLSIQDIRNLAITVVIEQSVDLGDDLRLCLPNLSDWQRFS